MKFIAALGCMFFVCLALWHFVPSSAHTLFTFHNITFSPLFFSFVIGTALLYGAIKK